MVQELVTDCLERKRLLVAFTDILQYSIEG